MPIEDRMTLEELRSEVRRCWDQQSDLAQALEDIPDMPTHNALRLLMHFPKGCWLHVAGLGKIEQRRLNDLTKYEFHEQPVPYKSEYESAAGVWVVLREALRAMRETANQPKQGKSDQ